MLKSPAPPPQIDALVEMLGSSRRDFVPIRKSFVQLRDDEKNPMPGPLAAVVRRGVPTALDQLVLLHARAAGRPDGEGLNYDVGLSVRVWARLLGLAEDESGRRTVGRNLADGRPQPAEVRGAGHEARRAGGRGVAAP